MDVAETAKRIREGVIHMTKGKNKKSPAMSPTEDGQSKSDTTMKFSEAIEVIRQGGKVRRVEWVNKKIYGSMSDGKLKLHTNESVDGKAKGYGLHEWLITDGDINADDYVTV